MAFCIPCAAVAAAMHHIHLAPPGPAPCCRRPMDEKTQGGTFVAWPLALGGRGQPFPVEQTATHHSPPHLPYHAYDCFLPCLTGVFKRQRTAPLATFFFCVKTRFPTAAAGGQLGGPAQSRAWREMQNSCRRANGCRLPSASALLAHPMSHTTESHRACLLTQRQTCIFSPALRVSPADLSLRTGGFTSPALPC
ncbi:hypothetical protein B0T19DRAFT_290729 [Cercophora scortea]|uniref:Uncharacterized protein n=1 Tax=Cercophora scortea TaxID=314031 RepID=A0AAE0M4A0_9PEZI|nr:hypothetical protein B0T19DRAFT_290729 [Cercophora scortea]